MGLWPRGKATGLHPVMRWFDSNKTYHFLTRELKIKIYSDYHDYYDGVQAHGFDDHVVYERKSVSEFIDNKRPLGSIVIDADLALLPEFHFKRPRLNYEERTKLNWKFRQKSQFCPFNKSDNPRATRGMLYFCAKAYPFYLAFTDDHRRRFSFEPGFDELVFQDEKKRYYYDWDREPGDHTPYKDWLASHMGEEIKPDIHFHFNSPSILYIGKTRIINPVMRDFDFQKIIDPYTAFQELDMFLGGVMANTKDPPSPQSDVEKVSAHGMDPKWSFRKPPVPK